MPGIIVRRCRRSDDEGILNVCYRTGFMGEELTGTELFNDKRLFGYMFCLYYPWYESDNCFVAVAEDNDNKIVGYIIGTMDTWKQEKRYAAHMVWRIILRLLFHTLWVHPETIMTMIMFLRGAGRNGPEDLYEKYPAHLHINILPEYQHYGIGGKLIYEFENNLLKKGIRGIHLRTSNKNFKAVPFYEKRGYRIIYQKEGSLWRGTEGYISLIFAKDLGKDV